MNKKADTIQKLREFRAQHMDHLFYIGHSGGKDSVVITHLTDLAFPGEHEHFPLVHTPKPGITHPKTIEFLYQLDRKVIYCPAKDHAELIWFDVQIDGTRMAEFDRTDGRSTDVVVEGRSVSRQKMTFYVKQGLFGLSFLYPIYDWSDAEVWEHIKEYGLAVSEEYAT